MTAEDIVVVLTALWLKPQYLKFRPRTRLAIHAMILIMGIVGCRPGSLAEIMYQDVDVSLVKDLADGKTVYPVVTVSVKHKKRQKWDKKSER